MLIAYGWPRILPISDSGESLVYLKVYEDLLLLVSASRIQLWNVAQHKVRLGDYSKEFSSNDEEGENLYAVWKADRKTVAVLTAACFLCLYEITVSNDRLSFSTEENHQMNRVYINRYARFKIVLRDQAVTAFASDSTAILLGLSDGSVQCISWTGESLGNVKLLDDGVPLSRLALENGTPQTSSRAIVQLEISLQLQLLVAIFRDGRLLQCLISRGGLHHLHEIVPDKWASTKDAVCASIGQHLQLLAVGSRRGTVELFNLADNLSQIRTISLFDWGYSVEDTGAINCISWTPENSALAVGWQKRGLSVWSVSGCRLMCSIRQGSPSTAISPSPSRNEPMANGVGHVVWAGQGFSLIASETKTASTLLEFPFVKNSLKRCVSGSNHVLDILYGEDRLLLVEFDDEEELKLQHLLLPQSYISAAWPIKHAAINEDGTYLAIAGQQGVILYDVSMKRWRVFGDVMQERQIRCCGLAWLGKVVVVCNHRETKNTFELSLYPRYHLDESSLLCRKLLPGKPLAIDVWRDYILVAFAPFNIQVFHVNMEGPLSPFKVPVSQLNTVRELSIVSVKRHPVAMQILPLTSSPKEHYQTPSSQQPARAMILRSDGELSILDMDQGSERSLISGIERFWLTSGHPEVAGLAEEVSWWGYGHRGMQVWYPSSTLKDETTELDPEIDFDREVYPLTICPSAGVVVGVSQRLSVSACSALPSFEPTPQVQTMLPGLLHHLLQRSKKDEALQLAKLSATTSHFSHSLEWLLFTVFDAAISGQNHSKKGTTGKREIGMLQQVCDLIRNFPEFADVVVSVARKTDGRHWPVLFAAAGDSTRLFEECFERKSYHTATCYILVIAKLEGPSVSQNVALRLLQATLDEYMYELAGELVQFLLRIGRDFENGSKDPKNSHSPLTSFFLRLPSSNTRRLSTESDVLTSTVRKILEDHAVDLMSRRELSDLVAFVRETQFNLTRFLQTEQGRAGARLDDFASALRTVNTKLPMDVLQSRLDAEFLLAHMRTAGFREWIVVLATLLRRAELLVELFRGDTRLWQAYRRTLDDFAEFHGFLSELEDAVVAAPSSSSSTATRTATATTTVR